MDSLYQENILAHYKHPQNKGVLSDADIIQRGHNVSCGDELTLYLKWGNDERLVAVSFEGVGCAISVSGASMLSEKIKGMRKGEMETLNRSDMDELYGVEVGPQREKCAMLALNTLHEALHTRL